MLISTASADLTQDDNHNHHKTGCIRYNQFNVL